MNNKEESQKNIFEVFSDTCQNFSNHSCIFFKRSSDPEFCGFSYSYLFSCSKKLACILYMMNVKRGQRVAILLDNGPYWPLSFFSIVAIQAVAVPIDNQLEFNQIREIIHHSQAVVIITEQKFIDKSSKQFEEIKSAKIINLDSPIFLKESSRFGGVPIYRDFNADKLACLFYTSGTTGEFKAVMLTHKNLLANCRSIKKLNILSSQDVVISLLPLHHIYAFTVTCLAPLLEGATICYPESISFKDISRCMKDNKVTLFVAVPKFFHKICIMIDDKIKKFNFFKRFILNLAINFSWYLSKLIKFNFAKIILKELHSLFGDSLKIMISGGARLDPKVSKRLSKFGFKILEGYGLTETSPVVTLNPIQRPKFGSVGVPIPGVRIRLIRKNTEAIGEVAIKGENVMLGYYRLPETNAKVFDKEWFLSGDLGYVDKEGYLYLVGRNNEIIVMSSGKNINPEELEQHYCNPCIKEICIVGQKGAVYGQNQQLIAVILPDEDYIRQTGEINVRDRIKWILDGLSQKLPPYKRINGFILSKTELPKTRLGKIKRFEVAAKVNQGQFEDFQQTLEQHPLSRFEKKALDYLSGYFKRPIKMSDHFELDLGLDSLDRIEMLSALQDLFNVEVSDDIALKLFESRTVGELIDISEQIITEDVFMKINENQEGNFWSEVFKSPISKRILKGIGLNFDLLDKFVCLFFAIIMKSVLRIFFLLEIEGKDNIPKRGPFLIVANHTSYLDGLIVASLLPFNLLMQTYFVGMAAIFRHPLLAWSQRIFRIIPIDININLSDTLRACDFLLNNSKNLCYFPEGQRSADGLLNVFKKGIGILIKETTVKDLVILPIYISGAYKAWGRHRKIPRLSKIKVRIGSPLDRNQLIIANASIPYETIAENLRIKIATLGDSFIQK